ncbi:helix-turn-helix domain-containing protein [Photobacterium damselae]|uniref:helix-turn-helix domain-containing protein n=1 Tax=Photobacterium damselae TaxID=38293 RepID=UPI000D060D78|nr:helix-turn-helix transcriptional regulator [Photobacterium damselae]PSB78437.1 transcriptional regulator [Photobacterium damselae subsp. damselae]
MQLNKKIKSIRLEEKLTQAQFAQMLDIPIRTIQEYEQLRFGVGLSTVVKITSHPELKKYTLWLMSDETSFSTGQISPAFSTQEKCGIIESGEVKRA